jgi:hypothetical protein
MNLDARAIFKLSALPDDALRELGRVTAHFALLEYDLIELIHFLLRLDAGSARAITSEQSFRGLQNLAFSLVKARREDQEQRFREILKLVATAEEKRNVVAHSLWGVGGTSHNGSVSIIRTKYTAKQRAGLKLSRQIMTSADIQQIAMEVSIAAYEVERFHFDLRRV